MAFRLDGNEFEKRIKRIQQKLPETLASIAESLQFQMQALVEEGYHQGSPSGPGGSGSKLYVRSGRLTRSWIPGQPGNVSSVETTADGRMKMELGTTVVYARIHEEGGFIKSRGKMERYFMARYMETNNEFFLALSLHVKKHGGVTIPARPTIRPAIERLTASAPDQIARELRDMLRSTE